ncbi:DUF6220 domain-containing protein [Halobacillus sp. MO56]
MKKSGRIIFIGLAALLLLCFTIQFLLAGMATFIHYEYWSDHTFFVHLFGFYLPLIMLVAALVCKFSRKIFGQLALVFGLTFLLYVTANISTHLPWAGALHPIIGILLFLAALAILRSSWIMTFIESQK